MMLFENHEVEIFEFGGKVLFNPRHVAECLDLSESALRSAVSEMSEKQVVKLTNSDVHSMDIRKLNNAGENFLTESGVYKLIFKSRKPEAEKFQDWVTDEVLPLIRKTGAYTMKMMSPIEILEMQVTLLKQHAEQLRRIEEEQKVQAIQLADHTEKLSLIEAKVTTTNSEYFSVSGYASLKGVRNLDVREAAKIGRYCTKLSKEQDIHVGKVKDERYGSVNIYHLDVLFQAFNELVFRQHQPKKFIKKIIKKSDNGKVISISK